MSISILASNSIESVKSIKDENMKYLKETFDIIDLNSDGLIDAQDLRAISDQFGTFVFIRFAFYK